MKKGQFDVAGDLARSWLPLPNPNGKSNSHVLFPWVNGLDITRRPSDTWIVDFGLDMPEDDASLFELPFAHVLAAVKPARDQVSNANERRKWWLHARPAPDLRSAVAGLPRFIATPRVAKHRLFVWIKPPVICDGQLVISARADDTTFGILHSRFHELWSLRLGTALEDRPRYTPSSTFETFPFPEGLTLTDTKGQPVAEGDLLFPPVTAEHLPAAVKIASAAQRLVTLRDNWLNPAEWVERVPEVAEGYPERIVAKPEHAAELKKRTLTNLYNARPAWLDNAHKALDKAVAEAYGWGDYDTDMSDDEVLRRLLALNVERSVAISKGDVAR
ncbi:type IIL restriction-modification enzyme MmeI [Stutzerimonas kunmingensis]|nr:type IIL restriction-modification enzyme MmeI [Stutzerimonas kunmingensis]